MTNLRLHDDEGDVTDEDDQSDNVSSVVSANMVQISKNPKEDVNKTVDVCRTYLTYKRKIRNPQVPHAQDSQVPTPQIGAAQMEGQVEYDIIARLKKIPALLSIYDALKMSPELRKALICALENPENFYDEVNKKDQGESSTACMTTITIDESDMMANIPNHNRPLFITGLINGMGINRVMVDGGSAVSLLPRRALSFLGVKVSQLYPSHLVI